MGFVTVHMFQKFRIYFYVVTNKLFNSQLAKLTSIVSSLAILKIMILSVCKGSSTTMGAYLRRVYFSRRTEKNKLNYFFLIFGSLLILISSAHEYQLFLLFYFVISLFFFILFYFFVLSFFLSLLSLFSVFFISLHVYLSVKLYILLNIYYCLVMLCTCIMRFKLDP